jgi:HEAT repeat protein
MITIHPFGRRGGVAPCLAAAVLLLVFATRPSGAQTVLSYEGREGLDAAWEWALETSAAEQSTSGFWVGYTFTRLMCENCFTGSYHDSDWDRLPTLGELVTGRRIDEGFRTLEDVARRKLSDLDGGGRIIPKEVAVLVKFDRNGRLPRDIDMTNMSLAFDIGSRPLLWLGHAENGESIRLLRSIYESRADEEARKGAVWAVGMHDEPDEAVSFLAGILNGNESDELRKSAAYGLGNQRAESAHRALREAAFSEGNEEVARATVYAIGNLELDAATATLQDVVELARRPVEIRKAALYALGNRDERAALGTLRGIALSDHPAELQKAATYAIGNLDIDGAVDALADILLRAPDVEVRKAALYAIGNLDTADAPLFLKKTALSSDSEELAKAAVYAMGNALDDNNVDALLDVLREAGSIEVRKAAVYAVGNADGSAAVAALKEVIENESSAEVRKAAVYALGNMDSAEAKRVLLALIGDIQ